MNRLIRSVDSPNTRRINLASPVVFAVIVGLALVGLQSQASFRLIRDHRYPDFLSLKSILDTKVYSSDPNQPSFAFNRFTQKGQGFFNQQMAFAGAIMALKDHMLKQKDDYYQIILPSLVFIDYLGSDEDVAFDQLYDVEHWNSFVPRVPRIVSYNASQHYQYDVHTRKMKPDVKAAHHPFFVDITNRAFQMYMGGYMKHLESGTRKELDPVDRLILSDALRPAPAVQAIVDDIVQDGHYAAVHLRFEQDYLCFNWPVKDRNLTIVLQRIEQAFGDHPPFSRIFFAINRMELENPNKMPHKPNPSLEACEAERQDNLNALNRALRDGMWNGTVQAFERPSLPNKFLRDRPVIFGAHIDAEICLGAKIFLGRFTSTFTKNIMRRRLIKGRHENYNYELGFHKMQGQIWPQPVKASGYDYHPNVTRVAPDETEPLVTFVIPSTLTRETLNRTIESLQKQTIPRWEAIVGVDTRTSTLPSLDESISAANRYYNDPRIRFVPITTASADRGTSRAKNGSGGVRNLVIQQHATADWVAFCDDDDTLTPYYIEYLQQGLHQISSPDILIFRMHDPKLDNAWFRGNLPPLAHGPVSSLLTVGISFAVRRSIMSNATTERADNGNFSTIEFVPGIAEDFYFLHKAQERGFSIGQTCCVGYHVRSAPPPNENRNSFCIWEKGYIVEKGFRPHRKIWPEHFDETRVLPCPGSH